MLTVGSLFAGVGGIELGLEWTGGFATVWQVEKDEYCRKVLARHWPNATRYNDVCTVGAHNLAPVDVICGGFPCQDISNAGKRAGIEGERSGLWREYARIVRELRPRYVLVENVAALLGRGLGVVLGDLSACGYDAEWSVLSAQNMGAPHLRERLFVVAYAERDGVRQQPESIAWSDGRTVAPCDGTSRELADPALDRRRTRGQRGSNTGRSWQHVTEQPMGDAIGGGRDRHARRRPETEPSDSRGWAIEPDVGRVANGIPAGIHGALNANEVDGQETLAAGSADAERDEMRSVRSDGELGTASPELLGARQVRGAVPALPHQGGPEGRPPQDEGNETVRRVRHAVPSEPQQETQDMQRGVSVGIGTHERTETLGWEAEPAIPRVAQGVPNRVDRLRALGNAVVPQCAEYVGRLILQMEQERQEAA